MTTKNISATEQNSNSIQYAIINELLESKFGFGMWIFILSMVGFLAGILLLIIGLADSDDDTIKISIVILVSSIAGSGLGFLITFKTEKNKPVNDPRLLNSLVLMNSQFYVANCLVKFGGADVKLLGTDQTRILVDFAIKDVEQNLQNVGEPYQLDISIAVNEQGNLITGDEFRIIHITLSQAKRRLWYIDHHKQTGLVWIFSEQKSFHLPIAAIRKKKLINAFEDINSVLSTFVKPRLDVRVSFLLPGSDMTAATILFGLVGAATTAFFDWQTQRNVEKLFAESPLIDKEGEENIIDTLKQNRWKFRVIK